MPFKPGQSGNPSGKSHQKLISDALRLVLRDKCPQEKKRRARVLADRLVTLACDGDVSAARLVLEYTEGKPAQAIQLDATVDAGPGLIAGIEAAALRARETAARLCRPIIDVEAESVPEIIPPHFPGR